CHARSSCSGWRGRSSDVTVVTARRRAPWSAHGMVIAVGEGCAISLGADLDRRLLASARRSGRSLEDLVREAVAGLLDAQREYRLPSWVGSWSGPDRSSG